MYLISNPGSGQAGSNVISALCTADESPRDAVYLFASGEVRRASAAQVATSRVVGFILDKGDATHCDFISGGELDGFVGLTPTKAYYLADALGGIALTPSGAGVGIKVGDALNETTLLIELDPEIDPV